MEERRRGATRLAVGLLVLRLGMAGYLVTHGWSKLRHLVAGDFAFMGDPIGLGPTASLVLVVVAEFLCALLVLVGLGTRLAAWPVIFSMGVAAFVAHGADPWTMEEGARRFLAKEAEFWGAKQPALMFLTAFLALAFTGAGKLSLDHWLRERRSQRRPRLR